MNNGPNMETFGARQARRFHERNGYARESLHLYRPGPHIIGKHVTKLVQQVGPEGVMLVPQTKRVTMPFSSWKEKVKPFWFLNLKADARRRANDTFRGFQHG